MDARISQLPAAGTLTGAEIIPITQGGATKRTTVEDIAGFVEVADFQFLTPVGATPGSGDNAAALNNWFADVIASGKPGFLPPGVYPCGSSLYWDLTSAATTGIVIFGAGGQQSVIDFTGTPGANLTIGGSTDLFGSSFSNIGIRADNASGPALELGHADYRDPINSFVIDGVWVKNTSDAAGAIGTRFNSVLDSQIYMVSNCGGTTAAASLVCRQTQFSYIGGSFSTAAIGIHFIDGYSFANTWLTPDIENVGICVQSDITTASRQVFVGGQFVWSGTALAVLNSASNNFRFIGINPGVSGTYVAGASAAVAQFDEFGIGTFVFGNVRVAPPAGDAFAEVDAIAGQSRGFSYRRAGNLRWQINANNAAEGGGNTGTDLIETRYNDAGAAIDNTRSVNRATGETTLSLVQATKFGCYGVAAPSTQPDNTVGSSSETSAGSVNATFQDTTFTGGVGATAYTIGQLIGALKKTGVIKQ